MISDTNPRRCAGGRTATEPAAWYLTKVEMAD
jgi:hypothetical protein